MLCYHLDIFGQVQGVGFRPFVYRLARSLNLTGWVKNVNGFVSLEIQGEAEKVNRFCVQLRTQAPAHSRINEIRQYEKPVIATHHIDFQLLSSHLQNRTEAIGLTPDHALCEPCLGELFDPKNRRYLYPFISCTQCGPRHTLLCTLPFDRSSTSMQSFSQCAECLLEFQNPEDRRFHSQINACPHCGPQYTLFDAQGAELCGAAVEQASARLRQGQILAIKGVGGLHLCCDAHNEQAVHRLRQLKIREQKPFALMVANLASAQSLVHVSAKEAQALCAGSRPIVLLQRRHEIGNTLAALAPGLDRLGIMLPYMPLHYLLFYAGGGNRPVPAEGLNQPSDLSLVMTSANVSGEPMVGNNAEALVRLKGLADAFLLHDRDIVNTVDDSVMQLSAEQPQILRRGRGLVAKSFQLKTDGPVTLALGSQLKNTFCVSVGNEVYVSEPMGDLDEVSNCERFSERIRFWLNLLGVQPERIAYDMHPDFYGSRLALQLIQEFNAQGYAVQHHHAHLAAVAAERHWSEPFIGLALDGFGYGSDGQPWGGELLLVDGDRFERHGHLQPLRLPGGDRAAKEPWRMAASALAQLGRAEEIAQRFPYAATPYVIRMLQTGLNAPWSSSCGRLFDAAAGLLGLIETVDYEAQAAMMLEQQALFYGPCAPWPEGYCIRADNCLDFSGVLDQISHCADRPAWAAALFHATLSVGLSEWVVRLSQKTGVYRIALAGGCLLNRVLRTQLRQCLLHAGLDVGECENFPPHDGSISLGQAWVARQVLPGNTHQVTPIR